jgi:hypothetical protein
MANRTNTFAGWQEGRVSSREEVVRRFLAVSRRTRVTYRYITDLAEAVAHQIALVEGKPCSTSTLLRNKRYKALLLNFMANLPGAENISTKVITDDKAKAIVTALELESANVRSENERLRLYVQSLEKQLEGKVLAAPTATESTVQSDESDLVINQLEVSLGLACKALWLVVSRFDGLIAAETEGQRLLDLSAHRREEREIVDAKTARPFFEWLRRNGEIAA